MNMLSNRKKALMKNLRNVHAILANNPLVFARLNRRQLIQVQLTNRAWNRASKQYLYSNIRGLLLFSSQYTLGLKEPYNQFISAVGRETRSLTVNRLNDVTNTLDCIFNPLQTCRLIEEITIFGPLFQSTNHPVQYPSVTKVYIRETVYPIASNFFGCISFVFPTLYGL